MKENILYLKKMGCDDENISTDIKNHRVRVIDNIDIVYEGKQYNMFFEFTQCTHYNYRTTNKRTGAKLKKPVREMIIKDGVHLSTSFDEIDENGFVSSWGLLKLENDFFDKHYAYTKQNILDFINHYKTGESSRK